MRYLFTNEILDAVLSATNGDSNYPVANLQDRFLQKRFQSTGEISQITSLMNTVAEVNCIAHGHTNATTIYSYLYGAGQFVGQAFTNLVQDGCDLRASGVNWASTDSKDEISTHSINGNLFTKVISDGDNVASNYQDFTDTFSNLILTGSVILKKGNTAGNIAQFVVYNTTESAFIFRIQPDWDNYGSSPATPIAGTLLDYEWIDIETLKLYYKCVTLVNLTDDVRIICYASNNTTAGEYTYWTEVQLIDEAAITMFPFVTETHAADTIDVEQTMPDIFAFDMIIDPKFAFDSSITHAIHTYYIDVTHRLRFIWNSSDDLFQIRWEDGGTVRTIESQQFGAGHTELNQRIRLVCFLNLISGVFTDSRFVTLPLESGAVNNATSFSGAPDIKSSDFPIWSMGNAAGVAQADSNFEYLRLYKWDGVDVGTITSSADVDAYLSGRTPSFEFEPDGVLFKESVVHNMNSDTDFTYFDKIKDIKQIVTTIEGPDPVYLGGLAAGEYYQMPDPEEAFPLPLRDNSYYEQSPSGQVLSNYEKPLEAPEWTFKGVTNDVANEIRSEYTELGKGTPFYADFFESNRDFYEPLYCFFTAEPGDNKNSRRRDYAVSLLEAR